MSNDIGCIIAIIWAHCVADLTVEVVAPDGGRVIFGDAGQLHVSISTMPDNQRQNTLIHHPEDPIIRLHERDLRVTLLKCRPSFSQTKRFSLATEERHPLLGYGDVRQYRILNRNVVISESSELFQQAVDAIASVALAMAANGCRKLLRIYQDIASEGLRSNGDFAEPWRIMAAAKILFDRHPPDTSNVHAQEGQNFLLEFEPESCFSETPLFGLVEEDVLRMKAVKCDVLSLAAIVFAIAHIHGIDSCTDVPLLLFPPPCHYVRLLETDNIVLDSTHMLFQVNSCDIFECLGCLLSSRFFDPENADPRGSGVLLSDFGWSVYMDTLIKRELDNLDPSLIHFRRGVPTDMTSGEQKERIRDEHNLAIKFWPPKKLSCARTPTFRPGKAAAVVERSELWSAHLSSFEL